MKETELVCMAIVQFFYVVRLLFTETHAHYQCLEDSRRDVVQSPVQLRCEFPKAWQDLFWEPDIPVLLILIAANLVAFLVTKSRINRRSHMICFETYLVIGTLQKRVFCCLIICIQGSFCSSLFPAYPRVASMRGHSLRMWCFHLILEGQVEHFFAHGEGPFNQFIGHTVACDPNTSIETTMFRQHSGCFLALFNVCPVSERRKVHDWNTRASF